MGRPASRNSQRRPIRGESHMRVGGFDGRLFGSVLLSELALPDLHVHFLQICLDLRGAVVIPDTGADAQVTADDVGVIQSCNRFLIQKRLSAALRDQVDFGLPPEVEVDRNLDIVADLFVFGSGLQDADIPALITQGLSSLGVVNDNTEIAITGTVVPPFLAGEIEVLEGSVLDIDVVHVSDSHLKISP